MSTEVEALLTKYREKRDAAKRDAEFYGLIVAELEATIPASQRKPKASSAPEKRAPKTRAPKKSAAKSTKSGRDKPIKAKVSAADAVTQLLAGSKTGLPASEIIQSVSTTYGHKRNSLRTTLYNLKKSGAILQGEDGLYKHPENVG